MILSDVRHYLKERKSVSLHDLMLHFDIDAQAVRGMLQILITKGYIRKTNANQACGTSCCKCDSSLIEIYEWLER